MHVAIVTAGGAGMFCGSCMQDNTWARGLMVSGTPVTLIPTYTPIRVDESNHAQSRVFFGGINVYLNARSRFWAALPSWTKSWLDHPWIIRQLTRFSVSNDASELGELTLRMLEGEDGPLREAGEELANYIGHELRPDIVVFSNSLLSGCLPQIRREFAGPVACILQGDDIFLNGLPASHRSPAITAVSTRAQEFDGFLTHSWYYRDLMANLLSLPPERFQRIPLSIDLAPHTDFPLDFPDRPFTLGFFSRLAPEKGLHHLLDAFEIVARQDPEIRLHVGGYLPVQHRKYYEAQLRRGAAFGERFRFCGSPNTIEDKVAFYRELDLFSVPAEYAEPKGIPVLEAWASGVPVVQPNSGAYPELVGTDESGGLLVPPQNAEALAHAILLLKRDPATRRRLAQAGATKVRTRHSHAVAAQVALTALQQITRH